MSHFHSTNRGRTYQAPWKCKHVGEKDALRSFNDAKLFLVLVGFSDQEGPIPKINLSPLDNVAVHFLAIKGYSALFSGSYYGNLGPGSFLGTLKVPNSVYYAIGMDMIVKGGEEMEDERVAAFCPTLVFVIVHDKDMPFFRRHYNEFEGFLKEKLVRFQYLADMTEPQFELIFQELNQYANQLSENDHFLETEQETLFDVTLLLRLPPAERQIAKGLLELDVAFSGNNIPLIELKKWMLQHYGNFDLNALKSLVQKGYVILVHPPEEKGKSSKIPYLRIRY